MNCNAKLALNWHWQLWKQGNIPIRNVNTTDSNISEAMNTGHSNVNLKSIFRDLIEEQSVLELTTTPH